MWWGWAWRGVGVAEAPYRKQLAADPYELVGDEADDSDEYAPR